MSAIELRAVAKRFGPTQVLTDVELDVATGSLTAVLGASGSGKTTLLRLIAGFDHPDQGTISVDGRLVADATRFVSPQQRDIGYVPQDGALFPHLTVEGNVGFGLSRRDRRRVGELLDLVGLGELRKRYPRELSGGQEQRVALARALAIRPRVVLLDEPFSALDASLRSELRRDVARILADADTTTVLVTHDQDEALALADQVAVLAGGRVVACAGPRELYRDPPDAAAAASIGEVNILQAHATAGQASCALGVVALRTNGGPPVEGAAQLLVRPEQLTLHLQAQPGAAQAAVAEVQYHGYDALARVRLAAGEMVLARIPGDLRLAAGQQVWVAVAGAAHAWPA